MFELNHVTKQFGDEYALRNISLTIHNGMNFIIGSSGSGKTTLLKIMSGMEPVFEGDASFRRQSVKTMSEAEKSQLRGSAFGFVWQDFNLLDDRSVLENVLLPQYLSQGQSEKAAQSILRELKISELAHQKVGKLSGGQKQRVAIARELMKNPQVIFADEPTSALDAQASKAILDILRTLSKKRTVIIVTHDTSLITDRDAVFELDKGELISAPLQTDAAGKKSTVPPGSASRLSASSAFSLGLTSIKRRFDRAAATVLAVLVAATLLLVSVSGAIVDTGKAAFDELLATYGESLLDITVTQSFTSAGNTDGQENDAPVADVSQDVDGVFNTYKNDPRVSYVLSAQAFNNISVTVDGKSYTVENSGTMPVANGVLKGTVPLGETNEVAVPENFVKELGMTNEQAIGREITFNAAVYDWENDQPYLTEVSGTATIVGVLDTTMVTEYGGKLYDTSIDDSFFFSPNALKEMLGQAGLKQDPGTFYIRVKTPEDLIAVKDELNAEGIVPLGRFELVEDMVRMDQQTAQLSSAAVSVIASLSLLMVAAVALMNALLRRREYAIFKVSGYTNRHLSGAALAEFSMLAAGSTVGFLLASPLLNLATTALWNVNIMNGTLLFAGALLTVCMTMLCCMVTIAVTASTKAVQALRTGDR